MIRIFFLVFMLVNQSLATYELVTGVLSFSTYCIVLTISLFTVFIFYPKGE